MVQCMFQLSGKAVYVNGILSRGQNLCAKYGKKIMILNDNHLDMKTDQGKYNNAKKKSLLYYLL